jgi:hypothetical protein
VRSALDLLSLVKGPQGFNICTGIDICGRLSVGGFEIFEFFGMPPFEIVVLELMDSLEMFNFGAVIFDYGLSLLVIVVQKAAYRQRSA